MNISKHFKKNSQRCTEKHFMERFLKRLHLTLFADLTWSPLGYLAERAPLGGILPPCLTEEHVAVAIWARRQTKALDEYF